MIMNATNEQLIPGQRAPVLSPADGQMPYVFALIHGAWHDSSTWAPLEAVLRAAGHETIAPTLPIDDVEATFSDDAALVAKELEGKDNIFVVGHSRGSETIPHLYANLDHRRFVGGVILNSGGPHGFKLQGKNSNLPRYTQRFTKGIQEVGDGRLSIYDPERAEDVFYHDVEDPKLVEVAIASLRPQRTPHPIDSATPPDYPADIRTFYMLSTQDRVLRLDRVAKVAHALLGRAPEKFHSGHTPQLSRPEQLGSKLITLANKAYAARAV